MSNSMSGWLALVAVIIGAVGAISGVAGYEDFKKRRCDQAVLTAFAFDRCTSVKGTFCVLTPTDIVRVNEAARTLKSCAKDPEQP